MREPRSKNRTPIVGGVSRRAAGLRLAGCIATALFLSVGMMADHAEQGQNPPSAGNAIPGSRASADRGADGKLVTIWEFPHHGIARFCYDKDPAVIYLKYDRFQHLTSIIKKDLSGAESSMGSFPGFPDERSLSCSDDGGTVAALEGFRNILFISKGKERAWYEFSKYFAYSVIGVNSLLSPDGRTINLPEMPQLIGGSDILREMQVLIFDREQVFSTDASLYLDGNGKITQLNYNRLNRENSFEKDDGFYIRELAACGGHHIATLSDDDTFRFRDLDVPVNSPDWLDGIGAKKLMRSYSDQIIYGRYGICAFPLIESDARMFKVEKMARLDGTGLKIFSFAESNTVLASDEVSFSKDGCYALIQRFSEVWEPVQFTMPQQVRLLGVESDQCNRSP